MHSAHLRQLESESIYILREVVAQFDRPVMLYSIGKDSSVLLHLAIKAFHPAPVPLPLLHVDAAWHSREMIAFRDEQAARASVELLVHANQEGSRAGVTPVMQTEALRQALEAHKFDAAIGGARRDEKSHAKERVFSHRTAGHRRDPRNQTPELWQLCNGRIGPGESMRVFPLANWAEVDVWRYICAEQVPVAPVYFAADRPVVERDGMLIMVGDGRLQLRPGEVPQMRRVRLRTFDCYPLTAAIESDAESVEEIIAELVTIRSPEARVRLLDSGQSASVEQKKQEAYF